jgi:excisionase family DNA binding protein
MATNVPKLTYSVPEVCEALQISRTTLWKLVRSRRLKPVRIGRRVLFSLKAVDEFLNGDSSGAHRSR